MQISQSWVLAITRIEELGRDFREPTAPGLLWQQTLWLAIPVAAIAASLLIYRIGERASQPLNRAALLSQLYRAHAFPRAARRLCTRIADACELSDPVVMMVSPTLFEQAVCKAGQSISFSQRQLVTLEWIRQRLFAQ